ncbi:hypothetical protein BC833DRAFT_572029 [Globomyces pollinis-pini]|nr:hypothetical protein BC833DRAFT_572029 [Globomyces pollinis-pini]
MDELLAHIIGSKPDSKLIQTLKSSSCLSSMTSNGLDPLDLISPKEHSLGYFFILINRFNHTNTINSMLCEKLLEFSTVFHKPSLSPIADIAFQFFSSLKLDLKLSTLIQTNFCLRWCQDGKKVYLTPLHPIILKRCLSLRSYRFALRLLKLNITDFRPDQPDGGDVKDYLLYNYYGGLIYIGLKMFDQAIISFNHCIYTPGQVTSAIQIEAAKKLILVTLINSGKAYNLPRQLPSSVQRAINQSLQPYQQFADAFDSFNFNKINKLFVTSEPTFVADDNLGLVKQCLEALVGKRIQQLTKTYLTLSIGDIEKIIGTIGISYLQPFTVETKICKMIEQGQIHASISHRDNGMISFKDDAGCFEGIDTADILDGEIDQLKVISAGVTSLDSKLGLSKAFLNATKTEFNNIGTDSIMMM